LWEERREACRELNKLIPDLNANINDATGELEMNNKALREHVALLVKKYEIEGAREKVKEIGFKKTDIGIRKSDLVAELARYNDTSGPRPQTTSGPVPPAGAFVAGNRYALQREIAALEKEEARLEHVQDTLVKLYGLDIFKTEDGNEDDGNDGKDKDGKGGKGGKGYSKKGRAGAGKAVTPRRRSRTSSSGRRSGRSARRPRPA